MAWSLAATLLCARSRLRDRAFPSDRGLLDSVSEAHPGKHLSQSLESSQSSPTVLRPRPQLEQYRQDAVAAHGLGAIATVADRGEAD
jgi:hypothetical protein